MSSLRVPSQRFDCLLGVHGIAVEARDAGEDASHVGDEETGVPGGGRCTGLYPNIID